MEKDKILKEIRVLPVKLPVEKETLDYLGGYQYKVKLDEQGASQFIFDRDLGSVFDRKFMEHRLRSIHSTLQDIHIGISHHKETYQVINCAVNVMWDQKETYLTIFNKDKSEREETIQKLDEMLR